MSNHTSFQYEHNKLRTEVPLPGDDLPKQKFLLEQKVEDLKKEKTRMVAYLEQKDLLIKRQAVEIKTLQAEVTQLQVQLQEMTIQNKQQTISQLQEQQQQYLQAQNEDTQPKPIQNTPQEIPQQQNHFGYYHNTFGDELDSPAFSHQNSHAQLPPQHSLAHFHQPPLQQPFPIQEEPLPAQYEEPEKLQSPPRSQPIEEDTILQEIFSLCQQINPSLPKPPKFTLQIGRQ